MSIGRTLRSAPRPTGHAVRPALRATGRAVRSALRRIWWYVREVSGESAYENYLAHRNRTHPDAPVLSRREFDALRTKPTVRCC